MNYDFIEGPLPAGWRDVKVGWFDAAQCGLFEIRPPNPNGSYTITSVRCIPNFSSEIVDVSGHVHDGGLNIQINYAPGKTLCNSVVYTPSCWRKI